MKKTKNQYIDLHCHPFSEYYEDKGKVINDAKQKGVEKIFVVGTDLNNCVETKEIASQHENVFPIIGIHPNDSWNEKLIDEFEKLVDSSVVGIGEVGLDYHYDNTPDKEMQKKCFIKQIEIARKNKIPVIVHSRDAHEDTYQIIKSYKEKYNEMNFIIHSYSSGPEYVQKYVELGVYFSFSGVITFKNAKTVQESAKLVPLNLIFCETDAPYLAPTPYRGKVNLPEYVIETTNFIANLKDISIDELLENIHNNLKKCFPKC